MEKKKTVSPLVHTSSYSKDPSSLPVSLLPHPAYLSSLCSPSYHPPILPFLLLSAGQASQTDRTTRPPTYYDLLSPSPCLPHFLLGSLGVNSSLPPAFPLPLPEKGSDIGQAGKHYGMEGQAGMGVAYGRGSGMVAWLGSAGQAGTTC